MSTRKQALTRRAYLRPAPKVKRKAARKSKTPDVQTQLDNIAKSLHALREAFERAYSDSHTRNHAPDKEVTPEPGTFESLR